MKILEKESHVFSCHSNPVMHPRNKNQRIIATGHMAKANKTLEILQKRLQMKSTANVTDQLPKGSSTNIDT